MAILSVTYTSVSKQPPWSTQSIPFYLDRHNVYQWKLRSKEAHCMIHLLSYSISWCVAEGYTNWDQNCSLVALQKSKDYFLHTDRFCISQIVKYGHKSSMQYHIIPFWWRKNKPSAIFLTTSLTSCSRNNPWRQMLCRRVPPSSFSKIIKILENKPIHAALHQLSAFVMSTAASWQSDSCWRFRHKGLSTTLLTVAVWPNNISQPEWQIIHQTLLSYYHTNVIPSVGFSHVCTILVFNQPSRPIQPGHHHSLGRQTSTGDVWPPLGQKTVSSV